MSRTEKVVEELAVCCRRAGRARSRYAVEVDCVTAMYRGVALWAGCPLLPLSFRSQIRPLQAGPHLRPGRLLQTPSCNECHSRSEIGNPSSGEILQVGEMQACGCHVRDPQTIARSLDLVWISIGNLEGLDPLCFVEACCQGINWRDLSRIHCLRAKSL